MKKIADWSSNNAGFFIILPIAIISIYLFNQDVKRDAKPFFECIDGDTFAVNGLSRTDYYRLSYIDTPEKDEPGYKEASEFTCSELYKMLDSDSTTLRINDEDIYNRLLVEIVYWDGSTLNEELIKRNLAVPYYKRTTDKIMDLYEQNKRK
jgi:endonuclease YncB( thermonuclease family)